MCPIKAHELYRFYHVGDEETAALRGLSISVAAGELVALMGPSGSGKSTLLACLAGLDEPDGGHVDIMGERLSRRPETKRARLRSRHIGILMQSGNLFDHLSVASNIGMQRWIAGNCSAEPLLERLGLTDLGEALPSQLSGGEAARAGLAVALAADPDILLCDEPTAEVDAETENKILNFLSERKDNGCAILVATHSPAVADRATRLVRISDGRVVPD